MRGHKDINKKGISMNVKKFKELLDSLPDDSHLFSENYDYGKTELNFARPEYFSVKDNGEITIKKIKEALQNYPDELHVFIEMQHLEPEDQDKLPVESVGIRAQVDGDVLSGHKVVISLKTPYI